MQATFVFVVFVSLSLVSHFPGTCLAIGQVIWAVNAGGNAHVDSYGIQYLKDPLTIGVPSDFGTNLIIQRINQQDQILYQTERYHDSTFGYDVPISEDGDYVLVLKFCEVWFTSPNQKVFDVTLNEEHAVVQDLDIFARAGFGVALDEYVPFAIMKGELLVNGEKSAFDKVLSVQFVKSRYDNPKVNALYIMKGRLEDVPRLPPLIHHEHSRNHQEGDDEEDEEGDEIEARRPSRRHSSGAKVQDPYAATDSFELVLPIAAAVATFVPILYCLCKI